jgi:hypothetical protein
LQWLLILEQLKCSGSFTRDNPHGTVESHYQYLFAINMWCGVIGDQLIGLYILPQHLTGDIYTNFLQMNCQHS